MLRQTVGPGPTHIRTTRNNRGETMDYYVEYNGKSRCVVRDVPGPVEALQKVKEVFSGGQMLSVQMIASVEVIDREMEDAGILDRIYHCYEEFERKHGIRPDYIHMSGHFFRKFKNNNVVKTLDNYSIRKTHGQFLPGILGVTITVNEEQPVDFIFENFTICLKCKSKKEDGPDGPWCQKCEPDAPRKFHEEETGG